MKLYSFAPFILFAAIFAAVGISLDPQRAGLITLAASLVGAVLKHVVPGKAINKIIPWVATIGGAVLGANVLDTNTTQVVGAVLGGLAGGTAVLGHKLLVTKTPLKHVQIPAWWNPDLKQKL